MSKRMYVLAAAIVAVSAGAAGAARVSAQTPAPPPIAVVPLSPRGSLGDDVEIQFRVKLDGAGTNVINLDGPMRIVTAEVIVQPGAQFPWHIHPGPVIVSVTSGELVYVQASDCIPRSYPSGDIFVDPGNAVHTAFNPTDVVTRLVATFFDVPESGPLTIPVDAPADCQIDAGTHASH
jgi:quercetin dioxygenase-like cupin family protein